MKDFDSDLTFPIGFYGDVSVTIIDDIDLDLGIVGEFSWEGRNETFLGVVDLSQTTFMGGARVSGAGGAGPYFQVLAGVVRVSAGIQGISSVSDSQLGVQIGGGVNARVGGPAAIRAGADYRYSSGLSEVRVVAGIAFGVGRR